MWYCLRWGDLPYSHPIRYDVTLQAQNTKEKAAAFFVDKWQAQREVHA